MDENIFIFLSYNGQKDICPERPVETVTKSDLDKVYPDLDEGLRPA